MVPVSYTQRIYQYNGTKLTQLDYIMFVVDTVQQIHHLQSKLSLRLRTRLTRYTHDLYLSSAPNLRYYRVGLEGGLDGVDQYITSDIAAFCEAFLQV